MAAGGEVVVQEARSVHDDLTFVLSTRPEKGFMDKNGFYAIMIGHNVLFNNIDNVV